MEKVIRINPTDNVVIALEELHPGDEIFLAKEKIIIKEVIPGGHKIAIKDINKGEDVIKYGAPIGQATSDIKRGSWIHTHNLRTKLKGKLDYVYKRTEIVKPGVLENIPKTFMGYLREDGRAGTRNEIWIIPTVSCVNQRAEIIAKEARKSLKDYLNTRKIDGIYEFKHPYGCSQMGEDQLNTQKILASLVKHPNALGVLVLGLGCENNNIPEFKKILGDYNPDRVKFLNAQDIADEVKTGVELILQLAKRAEETERKKLPVSYLNIGLKCGGSDGYSGITANPLVGRISDIIVSSGGSSVLTEVPEMFGAEHVLMSRAVNEKVFHKIVDLINEFKDYYLSHNQPIYENPSPGNKKGGITTLEDKSLGCTQKGGVSPVVDVIKYGELIKESGLNLLYSPGNDMVASTALAAAGCQMILFTTGRGTPLGSCVPTVKIATNSEIYNFKRDWMDYNAGILLEGTEMDDAEISLYNELIDIASGNKLAKNEILGFREIAILKTGVTL